MWPEQLEGDQSFGGQVLRDEDHPVTSPRQQVVHAVALPEDVARLEGH
jgi:hypothetical protein